MRACVYEDGWRGGVRVGGQRPSGSNRTAKTNSKYVYIRMLNNDLTNFSLGPINRYIKPLKAASKKLGTALSYYMSFLRKEIFYLLSPN